MDRLLSARLEVVAGTQPPSPEHQNSPGTAPASVDVWRLDRLSGTRHRGPFRLSSPSFPSLSVLSFAGVALKPLDARDCCSAVSSI